jgi:hypothetical protein
MRVFLGCEESGTVRDAFREQGHEAWSCDLLPSRGVNPKYHYQMDVMRALVTTEPWDLVILFPDCTAMATSGNKTYANSTERASAIAWTVALWEVAMTRAKSIALENPDSVIWGYLRDKCDTIQFVQPYMFGSRYKKRTGLALKNLKRLHPTNHLSRSEVAAIPREELARISNISAGPLRKRERSVTDPNMAKAMSLQWGDENYFRLANGFPQRA